MPKDGSIETRFWKNVNKNGAAPAHVPDIEQCWEWTAAKNEAGYGRFGYCKKVQYASRMSWIFAFGEIPAGMWVLHKCDNPGCVRPSHLFLGTPMDNIRDMMSKGRNKFGGGFRDLSKSKGNPIMLAVLLYCHRMNHSLSVKEMAKQIGIQHLVLWRFERGHSIQSEPFSKIVLWAFSE